MPSEAARIPTPSTITRRPPLLVNNPLTSHHRVHSPISGLTLRRKMPNLSGRSSGACPYPFRFSSGYALHGRRSPCLILGPRPSSPIVDDESDGLRYFRALSFHSRNQSRAHPGCPALYPLEFTVHPHSEHDRTITLQTLMLIVSLFLLTYISLPFP
jgi:hypothetical protein